MLKEHVLLDNLYYIPWVMCACLPLPYQKTIKNNKLLVKNIPYKLYYKYNRLISFQINYKYGLPKHTDLKYFFAYFNCWQVYARYLKKITPIKNKKYYKSLLCRMEIPVEVFFRENAYIYNYRSNLIKNVIEFFNKFKGMEYFLQFENHYKLYFKPLSYFKYKNNKFIFYNEPYPYWTSIINKNIFTSILVDRYIMNDILNDNSIKPYNYLYFWFYLFIKYLNYKQFVTRYVPEDFSIYINYPVNKDFIFKILDYFMYQKKYIHYLVFNDGAIGIYEKEKLCHERCSKVEYIHLDYEVEEINNKFKNLLK